MYKKQIYLTIPIYSPDKFNLYVCTSSPTLWLNSHGYKPEISRLNLQTATCLVSTMNPIFFYPWSTFIEVETHNTSSYITANKQDHVL